MASGITISISISQIAIFFVIMGAGVVATASFLLEDYSNNMGGEVGKKVVGCSAVIIAAGAVQILMSLLLYFKENMKKNWSYVSIILILVYIICFAIPLSDDVHANSFYAVVMANWILLFLVCGLLSNDSSPVAILFTMLGIGVLIFSSLVLKSYSGSSSTAKKVIGCSAAALVGGLIQTITSVILFFKGDTKKLWMYVNAFVCVLLIVCFAIPLAENVKGEKTIENFYAVTAIDFVVLFIVVGMFFKNHFKK